MPLAENLQGKALFPHVTYKHASVHVNFEPNPAKPLPFKCRMVRDATGSDVVVTKPDVPADGKYEVRFPVSMPDEGSFDWLDRFMETIFIYPITPTTPIGEGADQLAASGKPNAFGIAPEVQQMQSEAGAAGGVHGTLSIGAMFDDPSAVQLAGELQPGRPCSDGHGEAQSADRSQQRSR